MDHEEIAMTMEALRAERDQARAETDRQRQRADALETAARAFLRDASMPQCAACRERGVICIVTRQYRGWFACDQHDSGLGWKDLPHAPALRTLRALLGGES